MSEPTHFLTERIEADLAAGTYGGRVVTRFPPEPNGYLHVGHAKAIVTDFGLARRYGGRCHLRFDDTNPLVEDTEYVQAIQEDVRWLGYDWGEHLYYASDYFPQLFAFAERLIQEGRAYVCSLTEDQVREGRGTVTEPGVPSPDRDRSIEENLRLLREMRDGVHPDGAFTVRARIDMAHPNMKMRDPLLYRIRNAPHHRTGDTWHIYPMYDFAHGLSDAIEGVTHSFCTLEFENNRELYDWFVEAIFAPPVPRQYEFAKLQFTWVVLSKRRLIQLVREGHVWGWDDPRMPTLVGLRRRGVPPEALRRLVEHVGVARVESVIEWELFEHIVRDVLNPIAPRRFGVLRPLAVEITNWDAGLVEVEASDWPPDIGREGKRTVPFGRHLWIDREDFALDPPRDWKRLAPGREVRLKYAWVFRCDEVQTDESGQVIGLRGQIDPESRGGAGGRKGLGVIQWVEATTAVPATVRLVEHLYDRPDPMEHPDGFLAALRPDSLTVLDEARLEPSFAHVSAGDRVQLERLGYFFVDPADHRDGRLVLNRIVSLKDGYVKKADNQPQPDQVSADRTQSARPEDTRKRVRKSASEHLEALIQARPEIAARLEALEAEGLSEEEAASIGAEDILFRVYTEGRASGLGARAALNWVANEVRSVLRERGDVGLLLGHHLAELTRLVDSGEIVSSVARKVLAELVERGATAMEHVEKLGLRTVRDEGPLRALIAGAAASAPDKVAAYLGGRVSLKGYFVGAAMRGTGGRADPALVNQLVDELIGVPQVETP